MAAICKCTISTNYVFPNGQKEITKSIFSKEKIDEELNSIIQGSVFSKEKIDDLSNPQCFSIVRIRYLFREKSAVMIVDLCGGIEATIEFSRCNAIFSEIKDKIRAVYNRAFSIDHSGNDVL